MAIALHNIVFPSTIPNIILPTILIFNKLKPFNLSTHFADIFSVRHFTIYSIHISIVIQRIFYHTNLEIYFE